MSESLVPDGAQGGASASEDAGRTQSFNAGVYEVVRRIPRGCVATYGQVAALAGRPRAARFVGFALHANPEPGVIPCHRVVGADGSLTGYAGGLECKRTLLDLERRYGAR